MVKKDAPPEAPELPVGEWIVDGVLVVVPAPVEPEPAKAEKESEES